MKKVVVANNKTFANELKGRILIAYWKNIYLGYAKAYIKLFFTLLFKKCYYGPFKGEFGHSLVHNVPFLMYLHSKKVKIIYCGLALHKPFLLDEQGNSIIDDFRPLRDFFAEVMPTTNNTVPPIDVQEKINEFTNEATKSKYPFWNIGDNYYYWFIHRNWLLKGPFMKTYNLEKVYKNKEENAAVVFSRNIGIASQNNGESWDYEELVEKIKPYFDKIYVTGHPSMCKSFASSDKVEVCLTTDNAVILEKCANSKLIITQHSGANNIGEYTNTKVLIIFKGKLPIGSMQNTMRFRPYLGKRHELDFAYSLDEVEQYVKKMNE